VPLTAQQINDLKASIQGYAFPAVYFDFHNNIQVNAGNMPALEAVILGMLLSPQAQQTEYGLANVIYWGNANAGYQMYRVNQFRNRVTNAQLEEFQGLVGNGNIPTLQDIARIGMPQFSGISFVSKIIMFLDPTHYCVLDLLLSRLGGVQGGKALHNLVVNTQVRVTVNNSNAYYNWCQECQDISNQYYAGRYRVVDVERGFFNLIQNGQLEYAQQIYNAA